VSGLYEKKQQEIKEAVDKLADSVNDTLSDWDMIGKAFLGVHPYLLNQIALGVLYATARRQHDGRINTTLARASLQVHPELS
jgi:hypothetical protein